MTGEDFAALLDRRIEHIRSTLIRKASEYASNTDRLHNFKAAAAMLRTTPASALIGFLAKHLVSIFDLVEEQRQGVVRQDLDIMVDEKIGDAINYLILLEAVMKEKKSGK